MEETRVGGANSSVVTPAGDFALDADEVAVSVTNEFVTTGLRVDLTPTGPGQPRYGEGPFEVTLECVREVNGERVPVEIPGGAARALTLDNGYATDYADLPVGAECAATQTKTAGANSVEIDVKLVTLAAGEVAEIGIVDVFELGAIEVTKSLAGGASAEHENDVFEVELVCVRDLDGVPTPVEIPDGATRSFSSGETVLFAELPAGAECTLTETENGGADSSVLTTGLLPSSWTVTIGSSATAYVLTNVFLPPLVVTGVRAGLATMVALQLLFLGAVALILARRRRATARPFAG